MATYRTIDDTEINGDAPINSATAKALRDNTLAIQEGDASAVSAGKQITTAAIANNAVTADKIVAGAVRQSELNTSQGEVSTSGGSGNKTLPGGEYGFYPRVRTTSPDSITAQISNTLASTSNITNIYIASSGIQVVYANQRYINSSPPFDLGDGEVPLFVFLLLKNNSEIISTYAADVPPWAYNGPTSIMGKVEADGKKYQRKRVIDPESGRATIQKIEVTNAIKNADMDLIPHPFPDPLKPDESVVLINPPDTLSLLEMHESEESIGDLLRKDYIRIRQTPLNLATPPNVLAVDFSWRNTGRKPI